MMSFARWAFIPAVIIGWLGTAGPAEALTAQIRDEALFFSKDAIKKAEAEIKEIQRKYHEDVLIETFPTVPKEHEAEAKNTETRERFFERWAEERAREASVNGISILITKTPGHLEVAVGNKTRARAFTMENRTRLRDIMLTKFKVKEDDAALLDGVEYIRDTLSTNLGHAAGQAPAQIPRHEPAGGGGGGLGGYTLGGIICFGLLAVAVIWVVMGLIRAFTGGGGRYAGGGPGGGYGPGYGGGGYGGGGYGGGGGGGFMSGLLGGLFGAAAGSWMYDRFLRGDSPHTGLGGSQAYGADSGGSTGQDTDYSASVGDFDDGGQDTGGGDFGGDADTGGGGGDFGGGGGDFGGGGGGDFGGGGGDFGGGGGGDFGGGGGGDF